MIIPCALPHLRCSTSSCTLQSLRFLCVVALAFEPEAAGFWRCPLFSPLVVDAQKVCTRQPC